MNRASLVSRSVLGALVVTSFGAFAGQALAADFTYKPAGKLEQKEVYGFYENGYTEEKIFAPGIRFPIETAPAYANSQIFGIGGNGWDGNKPKQSSAGWKDPANYAYPWWDNYCEKRGWDMPMCPTGQGHQGQDIRAMDSALDKHWVVATVDGTITNAYEASTDYLVELMGADGTAYQYLHMSTVVVKDKQEVKKGDHLGKVGNRFFSGGQSVPTSTHLHWQMKRNGVYIPTYTTLVSSYSALLGVPTGSKYEAKFVSQSWPYSSAPAIDLTEGDVQTGFIELENTGTEVWKKGVVKLAPTPRDKASAFAAPSWISPTRVSTVDQDVKPGEKFKFPLDLSGNVVAGESKQTFGMVADGLAWFSDAAPLGGGPTDDQIEVKIVVKAAPPGSGGKAGAAGEAGTAGAGAEAQPGGQGGKSSGEAGSGAGKAGASSGKGGAANGGQSGGAGKGAGSPGSAGGAALGGGGQSGGQTGSAGEASSGTGGKAGRPATSREEPDASVAPSAEESGCGCRTTGSPVDGGAALLGLAAAGAALTSRRRRR